METVNSDTDRWEWLDRSPSHTHSMQPAEQESDQTQQKHKHVATTHK